MDLREIVEKSPKGITKKQAAYAMFPNNQYAYHSFTRMGAENIPMNEIQLRSLAEVTGFTVDEIMRMRDGLFQPTSKQEVRPDVDGI